MYIYICVYLCVLMKCFISGGKKEKNTKYVKYFQ